MIKIVWLVIASVLLSQPSVGAATKQRMPACGQSVANPPVLAAGEERNFPPGKLSAGDAIRCVAGGLTIEVLVPKPRQQGLVSKAANAWKKDGSRASIKATVWSNRRVVAACS